MNENTFSSNMKRIQPFKLRSYSYIHSITKYWDLISMFIGLSQTPAKLDCWYFSSKNELGINQWLPYHFLAKGRK